MIAVGTMQPFCNISLGTTGFELYARENLKWRRFNFEIIDL
jgi:hypothetical protein